MTDDISALNKIIDRADRLEQYGNATNIPELCGMIRDLAKMVKELKSAPVEAA